MLGLNQPLASMSFALRPFVAVQRYSALKYSEPSGQRGGATLFPPAFPHDLKRRPDLAGEKLVHDALANALPADWTVFYNACMEQQALYVATA